MFDELDLDRVIGFLLRFTYEQKKILFKLYLCFVIFLKWCKRRLICSSDRSESPCHLTAFPRSFLSVLRLSLFIIYCSSISSMILRVLLYVHHEPRDEDVRTVHAYRAIALPIFRGSDFFILFCAGRVSLANFVQSLVSLQFFFSTNRSIVLRKRKTNYLQNEYNFSGFPLIADRSLANSIGILLYPSFVNRRIIY